MTDSCKKSTPLMDSIPLSSVSPISFAMAKEGDTVTIKRKQAKKNEFRGHKIGAASDSYLVFKGITKIGMIPSEYQPLCNSQTTMKARIAAMNQSNNVITIQIQSQ